MKRAMKIGMSFLLISVVCLTAACAAKEESSGKKYKQTQEFGYINHDELVDIDGKQVVYFRGEWSHKLVWNKSEKENRSKYTDDVIPDVETAAAVATAIRDNLNVPESIKELVIKGVFYDELDDLWVVSFGEEGALGVGYIVVLQKKDGAVVYIGDEVIQTWHEPEDGPLPWGVTTT